MATLRPITPGTRWHKTPQGKVARCTASVRPCPYEHFDSQEEALDPRVRMAPGVSDQDIVTFSTVIGAPEPETPRGEYPRPSLRQAAERARQEFMRSGRRPTSPLGEFQVKLPGAKRLTLQRETYSLGRGEVGARYVVRYFPNAQGYEQALVDLNTRIDNVLLQKTLSKYFAKAGDALGPLERAQVEGAYEETCQRVAEVEVMVHGAEKAMKTLGVDVFDKSIPETHNLSTTYSRSPLQPYDITEALKYHAAKDDELHGVSLQVSEAFPGHPEAKWTMDRLPEGGWYMGVQVPKKDFVSTPISSPEEASAFLGEQLRAQGVLEPRVAEQTAYASTLMREVEPAVQSYEATVKARVGEPQFLTDEAYFFELDEVEESPLEAHEQLWDLYNT